MDDTKHLGRARERIANLEEERDQLRDECTRLRAALVGLVGVESEEELQAMEVAIRMTVAPEADKAAMLNAIHALLGTAE